VGEVARRDGYRHGRLGRQGGPGPRPQRRPHHPLRPRGCRRPRQGAHRRPRRGGRL
jgi:hypothetical protein